MLEVKIPAEIRAYKGKLVLGLTVRQVIAITSSLAIGIPLGVFGSKIMPVDYVMWAVILSVAPIIAWGFMKWKDMRFEELVVTMFKFYFLPQKRVYEDVEVNYLNYVKTILNARHIWQQRIDSGEIEDDEHSKKELQEEEDSYVFY